MSAASSGAPAPARDAADRAAYVAVLVFPLLVLAGGVAANSGLRDAARAMAEARGVTLFVPTLASCTDNAAMIAYVGARKLASGQRDDLGLAPYSRARGVKRGKIHAP